MVSTDIRLYLSSWQFEVLLKPAMGSVYVGIKDVTFSNKNILVQLKIQVSVTAAANITVVLQQTFNARADRTRLGDFNVSLVRIGTHSAVTWTQGGGVGGGGGQTG